MNEVTLPPCPNWYLNSILICANESTICWGARDAIVIAKRSNDTDILQYSIIDHAHSDKIIALSIAPPSEQSAKNLLASSDEGTVKVWDFDSSSLISTYTLPAKDKTSIVGIDWLKKEPNILCLITKEGILVWWNVIFDVKNKMSLGKVTATCIACCPHNTHFIAVGSMSGLLYIVDLRGKGSIVYKLRGHDAEILNLSWCPVDHNVINKTNDKDLLLASNGKDRSIFIWKVGGDGRCQTEINLPSSHFHSHQHKSKLNASVGNWTTILWIKPGLLLGSSIWGELISWDLSTTVKGKFPCNLVHAEHIRGLFCVAGIPSDFTNLKSDWRNTDDATNVTIWTSAQDRQLVCCNLNDRHATIKYKIPTQGGCVYCIAPCPLDTSRIAFGAGDSMLRLWNLSEDHVTSFDVKMFWQKIKSPIRALAWHPEKENLLAYGTMEGRTGILDTIGNKLPILLKQYHRNTIYTLNWGPNPSKNDYALYSCTEGELVYYDCKKPDEDPIPVMKSDCTEFSWKPDFSCLAVGCSNGSIKFFDRNLKQFGYSTFSIQKSVHCFVWHPESTTTDLKLSPYKNYAAIAHDGSSITIVDFSDLIAHSNRQEKNHEEIELSSLYNMHKIITELKGHSNKIFSLSWSPHLSGRLISSSYDKTVQVWNVESRELIATFLGHCGSVYSCLWSPLDPDLIISGSSDFTIRIWKLSDHPPVLPKNTTKPKKSIKKDNQSVETIIDDCAKQISDVSLDNTKNLTIGTSKQSKKTKCNKVSCFPNYIKRMNDKLITIQSIKDTIEEKQDDFSLFSEQGIDHIIDDEMITHDLNGKHHLNTTMDIWRDRLKTNLEEAVKAKRLNEHLISLAPSVSMKIWKEMCEAYAIQLTSEGHYHKAVSYLLGIHKTYQAIQVFSNAKMYEEAYVLAKCKLDPDDPILNNIIENWANAEIERGKFEQAALCYVKLKDFSKAANLLARRKNIHSLEMAAELARLSNDLDLARSLATHTVMQALKDSNLALARSMIHKFPSVKHLIAHVKAYERIEQIFNQCDETNIEKWLEGQSTGGLLEDLMNCEENDEKICQHAYYDDLIRNEFISTKIDKSTLVISVSHQIAMAITSDTEEKRFRHLINALNVITNSDNHKSTLLRIISHLDSKNPWSEDSIYKQKHSTCKSLRAYLCYGLMNWLVENIETLKNVDSIVNLIENLIEDVFDEKTVEYWSLTNKVEVLETAVASTLGKENIEIEESKNLDELNRLKNAKQTFLDERCSAPSPILAYVSATELINKLNDDLSTNFKNILFKKWNNVISMDFQ